MFLTLVLGLLTLLSLGLMLWQGWLALRFPLHRRNPVVSPAPGLTLLKPIKGCDAHTEACLRSWLEQEYPGPVQFLFGVAAEEDPACALVRRLIAQYPRHDARLVVCPRSIGPNAKVSILAALEPLVRHPVALVSDADVWAPRDLLANLPPVLERPGTGMACCFYRLTSEGGLAMRWEALAANADFWSSVLQARALKPLDFALGAAMAVPVSRLRAIGGFESLADDLADDYQLGRRIAEQGGRIELCPVVVECRSAPMGWREVWSHQLRWSRTIRVCQPAPYFFSILANPTLWPLLWLVARPSALAAVAGAVCLGARWAAALACERRLTETRCGRDWALAPLKDLLQAPIWALAFAGNRVVWRGRRFRVTSGGKLVSEEAPEPS